MHRLVVTYKKEGGYINPLPLILLEDSFFMVDLALDSNFSVFLNDRNELGTVSERAEFEQSIRVMVTDLMYRNVIGESNPGEIKNKIRLQISRVARRHDRLDDIFKIDISQSDDDPHVYEVSINYISGSISEFEVSE